MSVTASTLQETMFLAGYHKLSIIPVNKNKIPTIDSWKKYQSQRADMLQMADWLTNAEGLALVTGKVSGILVLDIDVKKHKNIDGWKYVKNKQLPPTTAVKTQNGGTHYYYKLPKGITYKNVTELHEGIDIKCEGGYVVMPGTAAYSWYDCLEFDGVEKLADIPNWLLKELEPYKKDNKKKKQPKKTTQKLKTDIQTVKNNTGNSKLPKSNKDTRNHFKSDLRIYTIMNFLGIDAEIGKAFNCILPSDKADTKPSASITQGKNGEYVYKDWRGSETAESYYTLPEVYASLHYKKKTKLKTNAEHKTWSLRLLADSGILQIEEIKTKELTEQLAKKPTVKKVYEGFIKLIQVKKLYNEEQETTAFSYRFASAWCGVALESARQAMIQLETFGYIERGEQVGKGYNRMNTYKLKN